MKIKTSDVVFFALAVAGGTLCYVIKGSETVLHSMKEAGWLLISILPQLAAGLLIGGLATRLVSQEKVASLLGARSGFRGIALATAVGVLTPGGPFTSFPLVYALRLAGADSGALIAYIAAWSLLGFNRIVVWELPLMGLEFTWIRVLASLPLPFIAGYLARYLSNLSVFHVSESPPE